MVIHKAQADVAFDGIIWSADRLRAVKFESETRLISDYTRWLSALIYIKILPVKATSDTIMEQDTEYILGFFGKRLGEARKEYVSYVKKGDRGRW